MQEIYLAVFSARTLNLRQPKNSRAPWSLEENDQIEKMQEKNKAPFLTFVWLINIVVYCLTPQ